MNTTVRFSLTYTEVLTMDTPNDSDKVVKLIQVNPDLPSKEELDSVKNMTEDLDRFVGIGFTEPDPETGEETIVFFGKKTNTLEANWLADELKEYVRNNY